MTPARTLLRRSRTPMGSDAAFLTPDGIDVDSTQNYEVVRRKVFFDDVHLVTLHRERGIAYLVVTGIAAAFFIGIAILIVAIDTDGWPWALPFLVAGLAFLVGFLIRMALGRDVITVSGRRSKAVLRFGSLRKDRAREVYGQICAAVRRGQSAMAPPPSAERPLPPDVPMPPDLPA
ncbi:MAG TPA: hypothetical protein VF432_25905 [Thermoanaerobaculia bacterium]